MTREQILQALYDAHMQLRIFAQAVEGEQVTGVPVSHLGGCRAVEMIADNIGETIEGLELLS